jgi:hypothetical protein
VREDSSLCFSVEKLENVQNRLSIYGPDNILELLHSSSEADFVLSRHETHLGAHVRVELGVQRKQLSSLLFGFVRETIGSALDFGEPSGNLVCHHGSFSFVETTTIMI